MVSRLLNFIVNLILPGLGYLFSNNYFYAVGVFVLCVLFSLTNNIYGFVFSIALQIYAMIDSDRKIQQLNAIK